MREALERSIADVVRSLQVCSGNLRTQLGALLEGRQQEAELAMAAPLDRMPGTGLAKE
jgi:hypothetical protein